MLDLANEDDMNLACDFYLGATSMLIEKPIMLIKPKQVKLAGGCVKYEFFQEYFLESNRNLQDKDFKIRLIFNGVNHYAPFFPKELGDVINTGYKTLKKVREVYQDVKQVIGKIPTKSKINGALQQMSIHLRAAAQIAETVQFECGVGDTTAVSQLPVPLQMGATEPILHKRKTAGETAETAEGEPPPKCRADGLDHKDTELMPRQCHCGKVFDTTNNLKHHITVIHKNDNWSCSAEWEYDDDSVEPCPQICSDRFALWKHFHTLHQGRYLYYCDIAGCDYGSDQKTEIPKQKLKKHNKKLQKDDPAIVCSNCKKVFSQKVKYDMHAKICGKLTNRPFACGQCVKSFRDRDQLRIHRKQDHPTKAGDRSGFYKCKECGKEYRSISACRRHMKKHDE